MNDSELGREETTEKSLAFEESETKTESNEESNASLEAQVVEIDHNIKKSEADVEERIEGVNKIRQDLGVSRGEADIPVVDRLRADIERLAAKKNELEKKLQEAVSFDVSQNHEEVINKARQAKIDWANSSELARRLKLKGADDGDINKIRDWLIDNAKGVRTIVLPPDKFGEAVQVLHEMTQDQSIQEGNAFYVSGSKKDVPENIKNSVFLKEQPPKPPMPPMPGKEGLTENDASGKVIDSNILHHELGHATEDGLLDSELYKDWKPNMKEGSPDAGYIGSIRETDTRVRSMFRDLTGVFDPEKETFGEEQIALLKDKQSRGELSKDTIDLFKHYDDATLIELANTLPAI